MVISQRVRDRRTKECGDRRARRLTAVARKLHSQRLTTLKMGTPVDVPDCHERGSPMWWFRNVVNQYLQLLLFNNWDILIDCISDQLWGVVTTTFGHMRSAYYAFIGRGPNR